MLSLLLTHLRLYLRVRDTSPNLLLAMRGNTVLSFVWMLMSLHSGCVERAGLSATTNKWNTFDYELQK